ncbi:MAG TPA: DEDD exonuclease domain-containing protein [Marmoricola sp.]|nr:DEDD exonuclease domain-containing protein [Marmoricola sp.]HNO38829.1 DEDD exonuclease domain-containing protein [Marmoricola sp.]
MQQWSGQMSFDELGRPLRDTTFVVLDLETTGGSAARGSMITEIGAVKVRGGEILGEFQTLVNPLAQIPAFITGLTGISNEMVVQAPPIESVLPAFLEFAHGAVLVAHNAPFDIGFLKHFAGEHWPAFEVLDTVRLARQVIPRSESADCKLSSLARLFQTETTPNHRALSDARATVEVLHGLLERVGNLGVHTLEELRLYNSRVSPTIRRKRYLAEHLPHEPGVYLFKDDSDRVLYVGTSGDLRKRVRSYFTGSEKRSRMGEMVTLATRVESITCSSRLEANVRELRLIAGRTPPYNRRGRQQHKLHWLKITNEPWPRLSLVRQVLDDGAEYFGPFSKRSQAEECLAALHQTFRIRQCTDRFGRNPRRSPCVLGQLGRCLSPCDGSTSPEAYAAEIARVKAALQGSPTAVIDQINQRMAQLSTTGRFEEAAVQRDRLMLFIRLLSRIQRLGALASCAELVAARRNQNGQWVVHVIRYGRLAGAGIIPVSTPAGEFVDQLCASAETVLPGSTPCASPEESELIATWLDHPQTRLIRTTGTWTCPVDGASRWSAQYDAIEESRKLVAGF